MKKNISCSLLFVLLLSMNGFACKSKPVKPTSPEKLKAVSLSEARLEEIQNTLELKGTFVPSDKLDVKAEVEGKVISALAQEGQNISIGDPLATIDSEKIRLLLEKNKQELRETELRIEAGMNLISSTPPPSPLAKEEDNSESNPTEKENKELDEVGEDDPKPLAREALRDQETAAPTPAPENGFNSSKNDLALRAEEATLDRIKADIALNEKKLEADQINASIAGFVSRKNVTDGSVVAVGDILYQIVRIDPVLLSVFVAKDIVSQFKKGDRLEVFSDEVPEETFSAEVVLVAAEPDPQNKNYEVKVSLSNTRQKLKGGMNGKIFAPLAELKKSIQIPASAVIEKNAKAYVYIVEKDLAVKREVSLGRKTSDKVEVKKGIKEGEKVVSKGLGSLVEEQEYIKVEN